MTRQMAAPLTAVDSLDRSVGDRPSFALDQVTKRYLGDNELLALDGISLVVRPGEFLTLVGASGCGKSTLLNLVSGLDKEPQASDAETGKSHELVAVKLLSGEARDHLVGRPPVRVRRPSPA